MTSKHCLKICTSGTEEVAPSVKEEKTADAEKRETIAMAKGSFFIIFPINL
jgi:hypothetical protein